MKYSAWILALSILGSTAMSGQDVGRSDPCHAMPTAGTPAAKNFVTFDQFDKELRLAITRQDAVALAFLVTFPLHVNDAGGTVSLDDAAALKTHFQEVFTPAVRKEILSEKNDEVGCNEKGIGYARGVIWVNASNRGYAIWSVNRDAVPPYPTNQSSAVKINYICKTETHRIVVDTVAGGGLRYRSWNEPRPVTDTPDLEIARVEGNFEGTQACAAPIYTFKNSKATYQLEGGLGCWGDSDGHSKGATGRLQVTVPRKPTIEAWCY
jgi:hypothetical protein